jgi:hypothetical protein
MTAVRIALLAAGLAAAAPVWAQPPADGSALVRALSACRTMTDSAARLACYDAAAGRLEAAERSGEVVVVDREQARAARRQAFGFNLPSLNIFNRGESEAELDRISLTLDSASPISDGWLFRTREGQVWRQTDGRRLSADPRRGDKLEVRRAAMGGYFMNVGGQRAIRVRRDQ